MAPEAPSPSSTASSESSSSSLSTGNSDPNKPMPELEKPPSADSTQSDGDGKSGSGNGSVKPNVISTRPNVAGKSEVGTQPQQTRNVVVLVQSTVTDDDGVTPAAGQTEQKRSPHTVTLTPASSSLRCAAPAVLASVVSSHNSGSSPKLSENRSTRVVGNAKPVATERLTARNRNLRRMESSPGTLTAAASSTPVNQNSRQVPAIGDGRVTRVVPRSQPAALKLAASPSTPLTVSTQPVSAVSSSAVPGQTSGLVVVGQEQGDRVPSSAVADRTAHRSTPVKNRQNVSHPTISKSKRTALSGENVHSDETVVDTSKSVSDSTKGDDVPEASPVNKPDAPPPSARRILPSTSDNTAAVPSNCVIGRVKQMSSRDEHHMTPVTSSYLAGGSRPKISRRTTVLGLAASRVPPPLPAVKHTGPVICDVFESLRRRQEQNAVAAAAAAAARHKAPSMVATKSRQRSARSAGSKTGRSSVVSVTARNTNKHPGSRQPSAAASRYRKPSAVHSTAGISSRTPRRRRASRSRSRSRRKRSRSVGERTEESEIESGVTTRASDVPLIGAVGRQTAVAKGDSVTGVEKLPPSETLKINKTATGQNYESSQSVRHCRTSHAAAGGCEMFEHRHACDVEIGVAGDKTRHKRSTSFNTAEHHETAFTGEVLNDQQENCRNQSSNDRLCRDAAGNLSFRSSRRQSQSAAPTTGGDDSTPGTTAEEEIQPHINQLPSTPTADMPALSSHVVTNHDAGLISAVDASRSSWKSSRRYRGTAAADGTAELTEACLFQDGNVGDAVTSTARDVGGVAGDDATAADVEDQEEEFDRSPRFVRKRDSIAMSSTGASSVVSRRPSVEKTQGGLGTLERDSTLSWHNGSLFDNTVTAKEMVRAGACITTLV